MLKMSSSSTLVRLKLISGLMSVTLQWEIKSPRGAVPPGRGYHVALLHDARIFISGGYNGVSVFDDFWILDLSAGAYLPQVVSLRRLLG